VEWTGPSSGETSSTGSLSWCPGKTAEGVLLDGWQACGLSPEVCRSIQRIIARGRSLLPLAQREEEALAACIAAFPPLHPQGIHVWETSGKKKVDVVVFTFLSRGKNALLVLLIRSVLGEHTKVRYDDISLFFPAMGGEGSADRVLEALRSIQEMTAMEMEEIVPIPSPHQSAWKFAAALPPAFLHEMAAFDTWQVDKFAEEFRKLPLYRVSPPDVPGPA